MSTLHLGSDLPALAGRLADALDGAARQGDFFAPATVVVPNRYVRKWLRLWLARRLGVAINLRFRELDDALWELLRALDPREHAVPPEPLEPDVDRLLVLSVLLEEDDGDLGLLRGYLQLQPPGLSRLTCRRAWHLADRIGRLLREYEHHREGVLTRPWLAGETVLSQAGPFQRQMERGQRALYRHLARPRDGRRALLDRHGSFKTLTQYLDELKGLRPAPTGRVVHVFGFTELSPLHVDALAWVGQFVDVRVYHPNVVASRYAPSPGTANVPPSPPLRGRGDGGEGVGWPLQGDTTLARPSGPHTPSLSPEAGEREPHGAAPPADALRSFARQVIDGCEPADRGRQLLQPWAKAGGECLWLVARLLDEPAFAVDRLEASDPPRVPGRRRGTTVKPPVTVLSRLQDQLLGRKSSGGPRRIDQDTSLQIVGCPGVAREVETVHNSILHNLREQPQLRQTDVAVLVTDMALYRPFLQAAFERPPQRLQYNLADFSAAGLSTLGQALLGMLDLALESFTRSRVFEVLLNPCFLARLGVDRGQALTWLQWAETLGIYQGWDADEKHEQGYPRSPLYAWRLGLQRLRLGRYMEVVGDEADGPAPRFGHVIPFADLACSDREHLDAFCRAVEGLLPALARLRRWQGAGRQWSSTLHRLVHDFLEVPADRPEEGQVRDELLAAFERLPLWDHLRPAGAPGLPLALVREFVHGQLETLEGSRGEYLTGGVTLAALQPMRPVPFALVYVLGLGEASFPGSNALDSFDLRGAARVDGDVRPAEQRTYQLLENVLAARQKLYLLYNNLDLAKDQPLLPSVPLQQLQRYLGHNVTRGEFHATDMPLYGDDDRFFDRAKQPYYQDVLVQYRDCDRYLALSAASRQERLVLDLAQQAELEEKRRQLHVEFPVAAGPVPPDRVPVTVSLSELRRFLQLPAQASLRRHLRVDDDEDVAVGDAEPLVTPDGPGRTMIRQALHQLVERAGRGDVRQALAEWADRFCQCYDEWRLRSKAPEHAFGDVDLKELRGELTERINGEGGLEAFLCEHAAMEFCGPVLLGESLTPLGAKLRFPGLRLRPGHELPAEAPAEVRLVGSARLAWCSATTFELLVVTTSREVAGRELHPTMFEPLLLYLALLANDEPGAGGTSSRQWLARRHFLAHVACKEGVRTWAYPAGGITPDEAVAYLAHLTQDFLDPGQYDLLPFDLLAKSPELRLAYYENVAARASAETYYQMLCDAVADDREAFFPVPIPLVVQMIHPEVPADALAKVRRRFGLLDRGPARARQEAERGPRRAGSRVKSP